MNEDHLRRELGRAVEHLSVPGVPYEEIARRGRRRKTQNRITQSLAALVVAMSVATGAVVATGADEGTQRVHSLDGSPGEPRSTTDGSRSTATPNATTKEPPSPTATSPTTAGSPTAQPETTSVPTMFATSTTITPSPAAVPEPTSPSPATIITTPPQERPIPTFGVSPAAGPPGTVIRLTGTACHQQVAQVGITPVGAASHWLLEIGPNDALGLGEPTVVAVPDRDGTWSATFAMPDDTLNVQENEYLIQAFCGVLDRDEAAGEFLYEAGSFHFDVTGREFVAPALRTTPSAGPPGAVVTFTGDRCDEREALVSVFHDLELVADLVVPVRPDGTFTGTFAVPTDASVGYPVDLFGRCGDLNYPLADFAVTAR